METAAFCAVAYRPDLMLVEVHFPNLNGSRRGKLPNDTDTTT
jgi:hypothetical protein